MGLAADRGKQTSAEVEQLIDPEKVKVQLTEGNSKSFWFAWFRT